MSSLKTLKTFAKYRGNHETFKPKYLNISYILCIYFYICYAIPDIHTIISIN